MPEPDVNGRFVYEFGAFVVDPRDKTIATNGESIQIPPKEFDTLLLLIENNGRVVPKAEMMSAIWQDTFVEEGNLATYVSRLRKIVNRNGEKIIDTVPKLGYRFNADLTKSYLGEGDSLLVEKRTVKKLEFEIGSGSAPESKRTLTISRRSLSLAAVILLGTLICTAAIFYFEKKPNPSSSNIGSIAVLPFRSINVDDNTKALGLGLADSLISRIGSVHHLVVRPTSVVVRFADTDQDSVEIGKKLGVDAVLEGTIQESDGHLRVNARLLSTANGSQLWAEKYDETMAKIFDVEDKLSYKITDTLTFELSNEENKRMARRGTSNSDAYEKYLQGRFFQRQNTAEGLERSVELYQQALALDPNFADAHAGIADAELIMYNFGIRPPPVVIPIARQSVKRALELSPDLSEAYTSLAMIQFLADHDWKSAEASLQTAISLNPNNADAYHRYGYFLTNMGRFDEALEKYKRAAAIDPLSPIVQTGVGLTHLYSRKFREAVSQFERITTENPDFSIPQWFLATSYESEGDDEKAFEANMRALELDGSDELSRRVRAAKQKEGMDAANRVWRDEVLKLEKNGKETAIDVAWRYATLADRANTLKWLEKAYQDGEPTIAEIKFLAKFDFVRDDPQFQALETQLDF